MVQFFHTHCDVYIIFSVFPILCLIHCNFANVYVCFWFIVICLCCGTNHWTHDGTLLNTLTGNLAWQLEELNRRAEMHLNDSSALNDTLSQAQSRTKELISRVSLLENTNRQLQVGRLFISI